MIIKEPMTFAEYCECKSYNMDAPFDAGHMELCWEDAQANADLTDLRDQYAGQAMVKLLEKLELRSIDQEGVASILADSAYEIADAMMAERQKRMEAGE